MVELPDVQKAKCHMVTSNLDDECGLGDASNCRVPSCHDICVSGDMSDVDMKTPAGRRTGTTYNTSTI